MRICALLLLAFAAVASSHAQTSYDKLTSRYRLAHCQERVETMVSMTGLHNFMEIFRDESAALESF